MYHSLIRTEKCGQTDHDLMYSKGSSRLNTFIAATSAVQMTQTTRSNPDHLTSYFDEMVGGNTMIKSILLAATVVMSTTVTSVYATNNDEPYCDEVDNLPPGQSCWDRTDYDEETGLYPCKDGSYESDYHDCK
jgi:hypothetical protein